MNLRDDLRSEAGRDADFTPQIPEYTVLRPIGKGRYGTVHLARDALGIYRAIKIVRRDQFQDERPYERELRGLRLFADVSRQHEGLVDILHVGRNDQEGYFYYVMELGDSASSQGPDNPESYTPRTLQSELDRRGILPPAECVRIGLGLSSAVAFMHHHGLVHRDIKPANVIFIAGIPRVADIGLVAEIRSQMTAVGTLDFMDPPTHGQECGDVFSLGRMLYVMATGLDSHRFPALPTQTNPNAAEFLELNEVLLAAGASDPQARYRTMDELHAHLAMLQAGESLRSIMRLRRWGRALRRYSAWAALLLVLALVILWQWFQQSQQARELRERRVGSYLANGSRAVDAQELLEALPWFVGALEMEQASPLRARNHRLRIGSALAASPRLLQLWSGNGLGFEAQFLPDGRHLLAPDPRGAAAVWEITTGRCVSTNPMGSANELAVLSPDGRFLFTGSPAAGGCLWDPARERLLRTLLPPPVARSNAVAAFSPDSQHLLFSYREEGRVRIWRCSTGEALHQFDFKGAIIQNLALDPSGKWLAVCSRNQGVSVFDFQSGQLISQFLNHTSWVYAADFSPRGSTLVSASYDRTARIWGAATGQEQLRIPHGGAVVDVRFSPDGERIATAGMDNVARIFQTQTGQLIGPPLPHETKVIRTAFSPSGQELLTVTVQGTIRVWSLAIANSAWPARALVASGSGHSLAWSEASQIVVAKAASREPVARWTIEDGPVQSLLFNSAGSRLLAICFQTNTQNQVVARCSLWNALNGQPLGPWFAPAGLGSLVELSPDGLKLAGAGQDAVEIWETQTGRLLAKAEAPAPEVRCLAWDPSSRYLAVGAGTRLSLYDAFRQRPVWPAPANHATAPVNLCFSPDGKKLAAACADKSINPGEARVWDVASGEPCSAPLPHKDGVLDVAISGDGRWLATASEDFTAQVWDLAAGRPAGRPFRHHDEVVSLAFAGGSPWLATACRDGTARIWDIESSEPLTPPLPHRARLASIRFADQDNSVITETWDGSRQLWRLPFDARPLEQLKRWAWLLSAERSGPLAIRKSAASASLQEEFAQVRSQDEAWQRR